ncbi:LysE family translocator [Rhodoferax sp. GW822-FHT02A01]|uniref:LysE family translocator n=1 Tax=Rhodoferax sp. GW822-FHT02A01 TaxID=3141537 RepID=UPI00315D767F
MDPHVIIAFTAVACIAILSPGPATILAIRNATAFGVRSVVWSALGNVSGLFCLSAASMMGLGVVLMSSVILFATVKVVGALYLFYMGVRQLTGRSRALVNAPDKTSIISQPNPLHLYREAVLTAATNPKPILFFTALFPQFIDVHTSMLLQFLVLTGIFVSLSFATLITYALLASRATSLLAQPGFAKWLNRTFGSIFIAFGVALLTLRRQSS